MANNTPSLSSYAFSEYGHDAKLYNGIAELEERIRTLEAELDGLSEFVNKFENDEASVLSMYLLVLSKERDHLRALLREALTWVSNVGLRARIHAALADETGEPKP